MADQPPPSRMFAGFRPTGRSGILMPSGGGMAQVLEAADEITKAEGALPKDLERKIGRLWNLYSAVWSNVNQYGAQEKPRQTASPALLRQAARQSLLDALIINARMFQMRHVSHRVSVEGKQKGWCLPGSTMIHTDAGRLPIAAIAARVRDGKTINVKSFADGRVVYAPVAAWTSKLHAGDLWCLEWGRGGRGSRLYSTPEHRVLTQRGWLAAGDVRVGDAVAIAHTALSPDQEQIVLGTLLGDGNIHRGGAGGGWPRLTVGHGERQWEYLHWMADALATLDPHIHDVRRTDTMLRGLPRHPERAFRTRARASLWETYWRVTRDGRKRVTREWLDRIGPLGLAVWAMDDGSMASRLTSARNISRRFIFCTDGFSRSECEIIRGWLADAYGLQASLVRAGSGRYTRVALTTAATRALQALVAEYIKLGDHEKTWLSPPVSRGQTCTYVQVTGSAPSPPKAKRRVYDIEVTGTHCFVVNDLIVHNSVRHIAYSDPNFKATDAIKARCKEVEAILARPNPAVHPQGLRDVLVKATQGNLILDRIAMVLFRDARGRVRSFHLLPPETIRPRLMVQLHYMEEYRLRSPDEATAEIFRKYGVDISEAAWVQMLDDGRIGGAWAEDEMIVEVTAPDDALDRWGWGLSCLERSLESSTLLIQALRYNGAQFTTKFPEAFLILNGDVDQEGLEAFKKQLYAEADPSRLPVLATGSEEVGKAQVMRVRETMRELQYPQLIRLAVALKCAAYRAHPSLVNFAPDQGGQRPIIANENQEMQIALAQEEGFHALLDVMGDMLTRGVVQSWYDDLVMVFDVEDAPDELEELQVGQIRTTIGETIDEWRATQGLPDLAKATDGVQDGKYVNSPVFVQMMQMKLQAAQLAQQEAAMQAQGAQGAGPAGEGDDEAGGFAGLEEQAAAEAEAQGAAATTGPGGPPNGLKGGGSPKPGMGQPGGPPRPPTQANPAERARARKSLSLTVEV